MKRIAFGLVLVFAACTAKKESSESVKTQSQSFILDSLLRFDSEAELIAAYGKENVSRDTAWYPEGMGQYMISTLYPNTNNEVEFTWTDSITFSHLEELTLHQDSSQWSTHGVKIGSKLHDLIRLNGKDFTFSGFGWDYGGGVFWNDGGNLSDLQLTMDFADYDSISEIEQDSLMGEQTVSSKSPAAIKTNPAVIEIILLPVKNRMQ
jgi:hypothetical protein